MPIRGPSDPHAEFGALWKPGPQETFGELYARGALPRPRQTRYDYDGYEHQYGHDYVEWLLTARNPHGYEDATEVEAAFEELHYVLDHRVDPFSARAILDGIRCATTQHLLRHSPTANTSQDHGCPLD